MARLVLGVLAVMAVGASAGKKITHSSVFSWDTDPLCGPGESPFDCHLKKVQCGAITRMLEPTGGYIKNFVVCVKSAAAEIGPHFFKGVGVAYTDTVGDKQVFPTITDVRRCALNSTGLMQPDMTLNRTAIAASVNTSFKNSPLGAVVAQAAATCPEPVGYMMADYMTCLKDACLKNVVELYPTTTVTPVTAAPSALPTDSPKVLDI